MKKILLAFIVFSLGLGLVIFGDKVAFLAEDLFFKDEARFRGVVSLVENGRLEDATSVLGFLSTGNSSPDIKSLALYNLGTLMIASASRGGDEAMVKSAFICFLESLRLTPKFFEAKFNLEKILKSGGDESEKEQKNSVREEAKKEQQIPEDKPLISQNYKPYGESGI